MVDVSSLVPLFDTIDDHVCRFLKMMGDNHRSLLNESISTHDGDMIAYYCYFFFFLGCIMMQGYGYRRDRACVVVSSEHGHQNEDVDI